MRNLHITSTWRATVTVEVADDFDTGLLDNLSPEAIDVHGEPIIEQITTGGAWLVDVDWEVS